MGCHMTGPNQIAHSFMNGIRHPNVCKFTCPEKAGEHHCIACIVLLPITRPNRSVAGSDDPTIETKIGQLAIHAVTAWASLVDKFYAPMATAQFPGQFGDRVRFIWNHAEEANLAISSCHRNGS